MAKRSEKHLKIGARRGGGKPPGYLWEVCFLDESIGDARFLNAEQYSHICEQYRELAQCIDPSHPLTIDVQTIEGYHELRDKGGVLGKLNFRGYFYIHKSAKRIVILGAYKKEEDGQASQAIKIRMRNRLKRYLKEFA